VELGLGHFVAPVYEFHSSIKLGNRSFIPYITGVWPPPTSSMARWVAKSALIDGRRLNPQLTIKQMISTASDIPNLLEALRKARLPRNEWRAAALY
jgi:hypothetical protein